ncbi:hypothetical protein DXC99_05065 [Collinsella sp. TF10-11AT]|nr:hypothetical protein DXC99_05065 [Collinsella sp. TF10-11AT]
MQIIMQQAVLSECSRALPKQPTHFGRNINTNTNSFNRSSDLIRYQSKLVINVHPGFVKRRDWVTAIDI